MRRRTLWSDCKQRVSSISDNPPICESALLKCSSFNVVVIIITILYSHLGSNFTSLSLSLSFSVFCMLVYSFFFRLVLIFNLCTPLIRCCKFKSSGTLHQYTEFLHMYSYVYVHTLYAYIIFIRIDTYIGNIGYFIWY